MKNFNQVIKLSFLAAALAFANGSYAQIAATRSGESERAAAKIMVIPYAKEGENIVTVLDNNPYIRTAMSKVKEAFDQRGWSTVDFVAQSRAAKARAAFSSDGQSDFKADLLQNAGTDFIVQVDVQLAKDAGGNNITLGVTAL